MVAAEESKPAAEESKPVEERIDEIYSYFEGLVGKYITHELNDKEVIFFDTVLQISEIMTRSATKRKRTAEINQVHSCRLTAFTILTLYLFQETEGFFKITETEGFYKFKILFDYVTRRQGEISEKIAEPETLFLTGYVFNSLPPSYDGLFVVQVFIFNDDNYYSHYHSFILIQSRDDVYIISSEWVEHVENPIKMFKTKVDYEDLATLVHDDVETRNTTSKKLFRNPFPSSRFAPRILYIDKRFFDQKTNQSNTLSGSETKTQEEPSSSTAEAHGGGKKKRKPTKKNRKHKKKHKYTKYRTSKNKKKLSRRKRGSRKSKRKNFNV